MAILGGESLAAKLSLFFIVACIGGWVFAMSSQQWVMKKNPYYRLEGGLFQIEVKKGYIALLGGSLLDPVTGAGLVWLNALLAKKFGVEEFREYMCALPKLPTLTDNVCFIAQSLQLATWTVIFSVGLSFVVLGAGGYLLYWYVYVKPRAAVRRWMKIAFMVAPLLQIGPLSFYIFAAMQVEDMFPRMSGAHLGHSILFASTASFMSMVPAFIVTAFLGRLLDEEFNEAKSEQKKLMREDPELYGAASVGSAPPPTEPSSGYMQQQQQQQLLLQQQQVLQQQQYMVSLSAQSQPRAGMFGGAYQNATSDFGQGGPTMSSGMYDGNAYGAGYTAGDPSGSAYNAGEYGAGQDSAGGMYGGDANEPAYLAGDNSGGSRYQAGACGAEQDSAAVPASEQFVADASGSEYATTQGAGYSYEHAAMASGYAGARDDASGQAGAWEQQSEAPSGAQYLHSTSPGSAQ